MKTPSASPGRQSQAAYAELCVEAAQETRASHAHVGALLASIEHTLTLLTSPLGEDRAVLRSAVEELRARRRASETSLLLAQELADRALDALESNEAAHSSSE